MQHFCLLMVTAATTAVTEKNASNDKVLFCFLPPSPSKWVLAGCDFTIITANSLYNLQWKQQQITNKLY